MGLDVSHDAWHGAYSAFSRWRNMLAKVAGYQIGTDERGRDDILGIDWDAYPMSVYEGWWDAVPADPLLVLIVHSDCDGAIYPREATALAGRLTELLPLLPEEGTGHLAAGYRVVTQRFIDGARAAVAADEPLEFS